MAASNNGSTRPYAGSQFFALRLLGGRVNAPTVLAAGAAPANIPLPGGGPGCMLLLDPSLPLVVLPVGLSDGAGDVTVPMSIPSRVGNPLLRWQFVQLDGALLWSSAGLFTQIQ
jgi:hypothetical protein